MLDIAILTTDNQYIEYRFECRSKVLTSIVGHRIRSLFDPYLITKQSDIIVNNLVDEKDPFYQYLMFLRQHIQFKLMSVDKKRTMGRIYYFLVKKSLRSGNTNKVWQMVIDKKICPWITREIDYKLQSYAEYEYYRNRLLRLSMLYLAVKNNLYSKVKQSKQKRQRALAEKTKV